MKCLLFFLNLSVLLSYVASLGITVQQQTLVGSPTLVLWTRDDADPDTMTFDLRFMQGNTDVGLSLANVEMGEEDDYGTASVTFPTQGQYTLRAVTGCPRTTVVGTSKQILAVGVNAASIPASTSASAATVAPTPTLSKASAPTSTSPSSVSSSTLTPTSPHTSDPLHPSSSSIPKYAASPQLNHLTRISNLPSAPRAASPSSLATPTPAPSSAASLAACSSSPSSPSSSSSSLNVAGPPNGG
ncbi:hypothetical protein GALMADRAFT_772643 [Galerina marginata CBS 339.88]|uniref:GOLD domain-containing protein n=1 Tax=Galerina marginata (strain CBS 339.88) TaxID=685588 RepID=A0A067SWD9_GALM3|nr:hypothetical protein GALMADRAFT_772643 [Galerina marginata CBS 339.88]